MSAVLDAFKIKPFDLNPIFTSWTDAPRFVGNSKKDPPVQEWLEKIKAGCKEQHVPKEYWNKVAQHYMGEHAKARLDELKLVMSKVHGGKYRWNWKRFKVAMLNMGWNIDVAATETVKVHTKRSGFWWITRNNNSADMSEYVVVDTPPPSASTSMPPQKPKRSQTFNTLTRKMTLKGKEKAEEPPAPSPPPAAPSTSSSFWMTKKEKESTPRPALHQKAASDTDVVLGHEQTSVTTANAPLWLINACNALDFLQTEHPKVMSSLAAILITVGTLPTIPAISAGAGGAILASGAVQAVGAIAVGIGSFIKTHQEVVNAKNSNNAASGSGSGSGVHEVNKG